MQVRKLAAGALLAAAVAAPTLTATAAQAAPPAGAVVAGDVVVLDFLVEGPFPTQSECNHRAVWWDHIDGRAHYCRYENGSGGYAQGWWIWARS
ncbi:hypothetical protein AB0J86_16460 [Micromonospora sp. NPDC049559]|uniref:hypothetical protein n=1 Tax=Micromonospora sp. NPDC049559 TaxID=3155923 RepID=UPI0034174A96